MSSSVLTVFFSGDSDHRIKIKIQKYPLKSNAKILLLYFSGFIVNIYPDIKFRIKVGFNFLRNLEICVFKGAKI